MISYAAGLLVCDYFKQRTGSNCFCCLNWLTCLQPEAMSAALGAAEGRTGNKRTIEQRKAECFKPFALGFIQTPLSLLRRQLPLEGEQILLVNALSVNSAYSRSLR